MKKILLVLMMAVLVTGVVGCTKKKTGALPQDGIILESGVVKQAVNNWKTYTNPAYRYELRFPTDWAFKDTGEDGRAATFFPKSNAKEAEMKGGNYYGSVVIVANSNWNEKYSLEEFYRHQDENLFLGGYKSEEITVGGVKGTMFKDVRNKDFENREKLVDLIALNLDDRILEIEIHEKAQWDNVRVLLSSIKFYPNAIKADLETN